MHPKLAKMNAGGLQFPRGHILHDYLEARVMPKIIGPIGIFLSFLFALPFGMNLLYQTAVVGLDALQLVLVGTCLEAAAFLRICPAPGPGCAARTSTTR